MLCLSRKIIRMQRLDSCAFEGSMLIGKPMHALTSPHDTSTPIAKRGTGDRRIRGHFRRRSLRMANLSRVRKHAHSANLTESDDWLGLRGNGGHSAAVLDTARNTLSSAICAITQLSRLGVGEQDCTYHSIVPKCKMTTNFDGITIDLSRPF